MKIFSSSVDLSVLNSPYSRADFKARNGALIMCCHILADADGEYQYRGYFNGLALDYKKEGSYGDKKSPWDIVGVWDRYSDKVSFITDEDKELIIPKETDTFNLVKNQNGHYRARNGAYISYLHLRNSCSEFRGYFNSHKHEYIHREYHYFPDGKCTSTNPDARDWDLMEYWNFKEFDESVNDDIALEYFGEQIKSAAERRAIEAAKQDFTFTGKIEATFATTVRALNEEEGLKIISQIPLDFKIEKQSYNSMVPVKVQMDKCEWDAAEKILMRSKSNEPKSKREIQTNINAAKEGNYRH